MYKNTRAGTSPALAPSNHILNRNDKSEHTTHLDNVVRIIIPKGHFVVMKTGTHPMRTRLRLFLDWGITFGDPYILPEKAARTVAYASRGELVQAITDEQIQKQQQKQKASKKEEKKNGGAGMQGQGEQVLDSSEKPVKKSGLYNTQKSEDRL